MAENKWYNGLQRLFSTGVVVRRIGKGKLKVVDTSNLQAAGGQKSSKIIDRYGRVYSSRHTSYSYGRPGGRYPDTLNNRLELYTDYEAMSTDSILSSALDIYSDECIQKDTIIPLLDGRKITIKDLFDNKEKDFWLYGMDMDGTFKPVKADKVSYNGKKQLYKITLDDGTDIKCTINHMWVKNDLSIVETGELKIGDGLYVLPTKISSAKNVAGYMMIRNGNKFDFLHRLIARKHKPLIEQKEAKKDHKYIHHSSFNKINNAPDELCWMSGKEHFIAHSEFNKKIWSDETLTHIYKDKTRAGHKKYWTAENRKIVGERQKIFNIEYCSKLTQEERNEMFGHPGDQNGMFGNGYKLEKEKNGRWLHDIDRLENINIHEYINIVVTDYSSVESLFNKLNDVYKLNYYEFFRINKYICDLYDVKNIREFAVKYKNEELEPVNISNHKIVSIEEYGFDEVYDIVNAGDNHVFAIETKDGGKLYTHNCSTRDLESGDVLNIKSKNEDTRQILENLFYDILNIDHNLWWWIRNLVKYGDFYLQLNLNPEYGVVNAEPLSSYDVIREEIYDDQTDQFKIKFLYQGADRRGEFQYFEIAHFRMLMDSNFLPYGKSMLEGARKTWKALVLMEDAMLINRIMRAPERRIIKVDIGNLKPDEVDGYMEKVMNKMKKVPYIDESTGEINMKFNLMPVAWYTKIPLLDGRIITIKELSEECDAGKKNYVYSIDKENKIVSGEVLQCVLTKKDADITRVTLDDNSYIDFEPNHPVMLRNGNYKAAKDLTENESLMPFHTEGLNTHLDDKVDHKVKSVESLPEKCDVYCMEVKDFHNFAIDSHDGTNRNGIFVKNSMMEDVFLAVRGDKSGTTVDTLAGLEWNAIDDIEYLRNRMIAALKIPKAFLGYEEGVEGKCIAPNTEITLLDGSILTIKEIADRFTENNEMDLWCYLFDFKTNSIIPAKIKLAEKTRKDAQIVRVHIDNDTYVDCTPDHHFILNGGTEVEAQDLKEGDSLQSGSPQSNHKVVRVEWLTEKIDTYNMEVDNENHNYLLSNGIVIKNSTLSVLDIRFSRTIEMIQRIVVSELTKIAIIHLFLQGYKGADLVEFDLELTNPSIIYEQEKVSLLAEKFSLISTMQGTGIISQDKMYKEIFDMSEDEIKDEKKRILDDYKWKFRLAQIESEGNDPAISGESYGTPHDLAAMSSEDEETPEKPDINVPKDKNAPGQGRPEEPTHYGAQDHPDGRDPLAKKDIEKSLEPDSSPLKHNFRGGPLALQNAIAYKNKKMIAELYDKEEEDDDKFLDESNIIDD